MYKRQLEAGVHFGHQTRRWNPKMAKYIFTERNGIYINTGGINAKNINEYLKFPKILACGGSWMVSGELINAGEFDKIQAMTREAVQTMLGFEVVHMGINTQNEQEALQVADMFGFVFGFAKKDGPISFFAGPQIEVMKSPYLGKKGHIAIGTNYLDRAMNYLTSHGVEFDEEHKLLDENGQMKGIYLKKEIGGFAVHLVRK